MQIGLCVFYLTFHLGYVTQGAWDGVAAGSARTRAQSGEMVAQHARSAACASVYMHTDGSEVAPSVTRALKSASEASQGGARSG